MSNIEATTKDTILSLLKETTINWQEVLSSIISSYDCTTGTLHFLEINTSLLKIQAYQGIPEFLLPKLSIIPIGKGMAGIAAERREAVEMCNLQTDTSGVARPAAKETKVEGSIAVPMLFDGSLYGTLGIAKPIPYDFTKEQVISLLEIASEIGKHLKTNA